MKGIEINRNLLFAFSALLLLSVYLVITFHQLLFFVPIGGILLGFLTLRFPLFILYALMATIPWSIEYNVTESLGTDLPDEPLMVLAAGVTILFLVRKIQLADFRKIHPIILLLLLQVFWIAVTTVNSTFPLVSVKYFLAKLWYILAFTALPMLFLYKKEQIRTAAIILFSSMSLFAIVTMFRHEAYNFTFEKINDSLVPFYRNHVNYSALLTIVIPIAWAIRRLSTGKAFRVFMSLFILAMIVALYFSYSRGAWLALIAAIVAYHLLKRELLLKAYFGALAIILAAILWLKADNKYLDFSPNFNETIFHTDFSDHLAATYEMKDVSTTERYYRWIAGVRMVSEKPIEGFGPNTFYNNYKSYTVPAFKTWVSKNEERSTVHNYFLLLFIEQGIIGLLLFLFLMGACFYYAQKLYKESADPFWKTTAAVIALLLVIISTVNFLSDLIETDKVGSIFYLLLALLVIGNREVAKVSRPETIQL